MTGRKFVDHLHQKECWFWCRLRWSPKEDIVLERIGESPEDAYYEWLSKRDTMFRFDTPPELIKAAEAEEEMKRGDMGIPEWLYWEERNDGIVAAIEGTLDYSRTDDLPTWARFGLENGIAPFQPFLLRFPMPHYSKSYIWEYGCYEYDVDYDFEVMRVIPWPKERVLRQWERFLKDFTVTAGAL